MKRTLICLARYCVMNGVIVYRLSSLYAHRLRYMYFGSIYGDMPPYINQLQVKKEKFG